MAVNPVSGATVQPNGSSSSTNVSAASFAQTFDSFLTLLTTQLKNQDPLSPLSATEFTTQLVQFAGVEQSIKQSQNLDQMLALEKASQSMSVLSYIGKTITAGGASVALEDSKATFAYTLPEGAQKTTITIRNANGDVIRTIDGEIDKGEHVFNWDGKTDAGITAPDGIYTFSVSAIKGSNTPVEVTTTFSGVVTGVEGYDGQLVLTVGDKKIPLSDVLGVHATPAASDQAAG